MIHATSSAGNWRDRRVVLRHRQIELAAGDFGRGGRLGPGDRHRRSSASGSSVAVQRRGTRQGAVGIEADHRIGMQALPGRRPARAAPCPARQCRPGRAAAGGSRPAASPTGRRPPAAQRPDWRLRRRRAGPASASGAARVLHEVELPHQCGVERRIGLQGRRAQPHQPVVGADEPEQQPAAPGDPVTAADSGMPLMNSTADKKKAPDPRAEGGRWRPVMAGDANQLFGRSAFAGIDRGARRRLARRRRPVRPLRTSAMARRSASSIASLALRAWWYAMPVPAGIRRPTMTFSFRPRSSSRLPMIAASVSTRVVSWKEAAEMNESVDSEAFVIPSSRLL